MVAGSSLNSYNLVFHKLWWRIIYLLKCSAKSSVEIVLKFLADKKKKRILVKFLELSSTLDLGVLGWPHQVCQMELLQL